MRTVFYLKVLMACLSIALATSGCSKDKKEDDEKAKAAAEAKKGKEPEKAKPKPKKDTPETLARLLKTEEDYEDEAERDISA